ncbi:hypothetical protein ACE1AT_11465 [Pelatocladus sp. BLCC-F211]|uniref:hypothetical protein n=1 Tax=Pelatocladus sp. BLCC-F211 TaxID=3342752 RepID=UPI0035BB4414
MATDTTGYIKKISSFTLNPGWYSSAIRPTSGSPTFTAFTANIANVAVIGTSAPANTINSGRRAVLNSSSLPSIASLQGLSSSQVPAIWFKVQ